MSDIENLNEKKITLEVKGVDFTFNVNRTEYNKYINSITQNSKVAPSHNFLMCTVDETQRATLRDFLKDTPASEVSIAGQVLEEYTPDLGIVVKKSSSAQSE
jgi:hypothetical protein